MAKSRVKKKLHGLQVLQPPLVQDGCCKFRDAKGPGQGTDLLLLGRGERLERENLMG
jgi:hypothetical protein